MSAEPDVVVVGGGPVGLASAIGCRQRGLSVTLLERRRPPLDKPCGEGLMPDALEHLEALGVTPGEIGGRPFAGIRYLDEGSSVEGRFPGRPGLGVRRLRLHRALVERAERVGVELRWGTRVAGLAERSRARYALRADDREWTPQWIVAADGLRSPLRREAGLGGRSRGPRRFGIRRHFEAEPWSDCVEVHWAEGSEAYVTPVGEREVGVAVLWTPGREEDRDAAPPFERLLGSFPRLGDRLGDARASNRALGIGPLWQPTRGVVRRNLLLVGDAGGYLDAITGEGMALGFQQARAAAAAIGRERPREYARERRRWARLPDALTRLTLVLSRHPALRRRVLASFARRPELFARLLAVHVREAGAGEGTAALVALGWQLLRRA